MVDVEVMHALANPARAGAAVGSAARHAGERLTPLRLASELTVLERRKETVLGKEIRVVVAVVRAGVDVLCVSGNELLNLKVVECGQLNRTRGRGVGFLRSRSRRSPGPRAIDVIDVARPKS